MSIDIEKLRQDMKDDKHSRLREGLSIDIFNAGKTGVYIMGRRKWKKQC